MTTRLKRIQVCAALLSLAFLPPDARADGGVVRLRQTQGPFIVTLFTAAEAVKDTPADVSVLVQERDSNEAILDATVNLQFTPPASLPAEAADPLCSRTTATAATTAHPAPFSVPATRNQASNKLLYAAPVNFNASGQWQLLASVKRGNDAAKIACTIPVALPPQKLMGLFPYLIPPPLIAALFALNQWLRGRLREKLPSQLALLARPPCRSVETSSCYRTQDATRLTIAG